MSSLAEPAFSYQLSAVSYQLSAFGAQASGRKKLRERLLIADG
jgi:hypothetical protein